jgi:hypothetical protein
MRKHVYQTRLNDLVKKQTQGNGGGKKRFTNKKRHYKKRHYKKRSKSIKNK